MNILVVGLSCGFGDTIMLTPALKMLKHIYPLSKITYTGNPTFYSILKYSPYIDDFLPYDSTSETKTHISILSKIKYLIQLRKNKYSIAVIFRRAFESALYPYLARIPLRVGYDSDNRGFLLTKKLNDNDYHKYHQVDYFLNIVKSLNSNNKSFTECRLELYTSQDEEKYIDNLLNNVIERSNPESVRLIGLVVSSAHINKNIPIKTLIELSNIINFKLKNTLVLLIGDQSSIYLEKQFNDADIKYISTIGLLSPIHMISLVKRLTILITPDTFALHAANALDVPTISLFGPTNPKKTGPYFNNIKHVVITSDVECLFCNEEDTCSNSNCCISSITADTIFNHLLSLI